MIRVSCKKCGNYDLHGVKKTTPQGRTEPKSKEELFTEVSKFFKVPTETIKKRGKELQVPCCLVCTPQVREEYDYINNVNGKMTAAKSAAKRKLSLREGKEKGGHRRWELSLGKNK